MITNWAVDTEFFTWEDDAGAIVEKGVRKQFKDALYNQLEVDPYSCTVVATATAITNLTGKIIPYSLMKKALDNMKKDGKFTSGYGAALRDWVNYMVMAFNEEFKASITPVLIPLTESSLYHGLKFSPVVSGIKYWKKYFQDEQDNGEINLSAEEVGGSSGHAITFVKANTIDDYLVKYAENYAGKLTYNVIMTNFTKNRKLFFNSAYYFKTN